MKTRCRSHGPRQRQMTVSSSVVPAQEDSAKKDRTSFDSLDVESGKGTHTVHGTRSQKLASKSSAREAHAGTIKDPTVIATEISSSAPGVSTRSSSRPAKRQKTSDQSILTTRNQASKDDHPSTTSTSGNQQKQTSRKRPKKRGKRQWESWGNRDKNAFFEALHDYGKDFDKIQGYLTTKHKRREDPVHLIKNKDQVRHFYYRTLNKISKFIPEDKQPTRESDPHQRTVYELVALTCYGELRKKVFGGLDKLGKKLNELIAYGRTTVRHNGRTIRLKAPVCRLIKENDPANQSPPLPQKLLLEFLPVDNVAWMTVQRLAQNPRLKTSVAPKKSLSVLLGFLMNKWPVKSLKTGAPLELCVAVPPGYESSEESAITADDSPSSGTSKTPEKTLPNDTCTVGESSTNCLTNGEVNSCDTLMEVDSASSPMDRVTHDNASKKDCKHLSCTSGKCDCSPDATSPGKSDMTVKIPQPNWWTSETCGNITVGDIYSKLKRPPKLKFEYTWMKEKDSSAGHCTNSLNKLISVAKTEFRVLKKSQSAHKSTAKDSGSATSPLSSNVTRTTRIAPKHPFILPSIVPSAVTTSGNFAMPSPSSTSSFYSHGSNRKRMRKREFPAPMQRKLLPRPGAALLPGAVAVSFIHQPGQDVGKVITSGASTGHLSSTATAHSAGVKAGTRSQSRTPVSAVPTASTAATIQVPSSPASMSPSATSPGMPLTPAASPVPFSEPSATSPVVLSEPITTVLETGVQQPLLVQDDVIPISTVSEVDNTHGLALSHAAGISLSAGSVPLSCDTDQFVNTCTLSSFSGGNSANELDMIGLPSDQIVQLDPIVSMNEDSGSDLLASIMGLSKTNTLFTTTQTVNTDTTANSGISTIVSSNLHVEELSSGISGQLQSSFSRLGDLLGVSNIEMGTPGVVSSQGCFGNGEASVAAVSVVTSPVTSPTYSTLLPISITSPGAEHQWLNGGDTSDSFGSFLDKIIVSPEKDRKPVLSEVSVAAIMDTASQDLLMTPRHLPITTDMDNALQSMLDENSVDFVKKFQDLVKGFSNTDGNCSDSNSSSGMLSFKNILDKGPSGK